MSRRKRYYSFDGLAGCVQRCRAREAGTTIAVYYALDAGLDSDPDAPWVTSCEEHGIIVSHRTLTLAKRHAAAPTGWCEECREITEKNPVKNYRKQESE